MQLEFQVYEALCATSVFIINEKWANAYEFGDQQDEDPEDSEEYGCGNMRFRRHPPTSEILEKYSITEAEYNEVCDKLEESLSFGNCRWCE